MSVTIRTRAIVVASLDTDAKLVQFKREDSTIDQVTETFDLEASDTIELAASEADYALQKGKIANIQFIYIESDRALTIKLDGEVAGHKIGPPATGTKAKLLLRTSGMTAVPTLTNDDTSNAATVSYILAGSKS